VSRTQWVMVDDSAADAAAGLNMVSAVASLLAQGASCQALHWRGGSLNTGHRSGAAALKRLADTVVAKYDTVPPAPDRTLM
jgi:hypothetical protein